MKKKLSKKKTKKKNNCPAQELLPTHAIHCAQAAGDGCPHPRADVLPSRRPGADKGALEGQALGAGRRAQQDTRSAEAKLQVRNRALP